MTQAVEEWRARGRELDLDAGRIFVVDVPAQRDEGRDPVLVLHGYPTCSIDWRHVLGELSRDRRVLLFDFPGFGLSEKPDMRYSIRFYADVAEQVVKATGGERFVLVTHDMGDTVGGELLARDLEGALPFEISNRILSNGSIYIEMAHLTPGQQMLLSFDDARVDLVQGDAFRAGLGSTFSPGHAASAEELDVQWEMASYNDGHTLMARTIRYIEDRRAEESRFTGAIERHPSPLGVIWGKLDPVAVYPMTARLLEARPDAELITLDDVGHYPMVEDPEAFGAALRRFLGR